MRASSSICRLGAALVLTLAFWLAPGLQAAVDYYLFVPRVAGEAGPGPHQDWIVVNGVSEVLTKVPSKAPVLSELFLDKATDRSSIALEAAAANGTALGDLTLDVVDEASGVVSYRIMLRDVYVTSVLQMGGAPSRLTDRLTLNFTKIEWTYTQTSTGANVTSSYDETTGTGLAGPLPTTTTDSDGDGISDDYELANGLNPQRNDAAGDLDGDGASNVAEFIAGTRANDSKSVFRVSGVTLAGGQSLVTWNSVAGKTYTLLGSASPAGPFTIIKAGIRSSGNGQTSTTAIASGGIYFYRVQTP